jgi:Ca2+/Na+ antiporter
MKLLSPSQYSSDVFMSFLTTAMDTLHGQWTVQAFLFTCYVYYLLYVYYNEKESNRGE